MNSVADVAGLVHTDPNISRLHLFFFFQFLCIVLPCFFYTGNGNCAWLHLWDQITDMPGMERSRYSLVLIKCGSFAVTAQDQPGDFHIYSTARNKPSDLVFLKTISTCVMLWVIPVRQVVPLHLAPRLLDVPAGIVGSSQCEQPVQRVWVFPTVWLLLCIKSPVCWGVWGRFICTSPAESSAGMEEGGGVRNHCSRAAVGDRQGNKGTAPRQNALFWKAAWGENSHILWQQNQ